MNKDRLISKRKQTVQAQQNASNDFVSRNFTIYLIMMWVLYPLAALYSALTEGGHLFSRFEETMNNTTLAVVATVLIVIMIEVGSIVTGKGAASDIVEGVFGEDSSHLRMFISKLVLFVICFTFSCILSIKGGSETTAYIRKQTAPPTLIDREEINSRFDERIALQQSTIDDARKMTWKGRITRKGQAIIEGARTEIQNIESERSTTLLSADETDAKTVSTWEEDTTETGQWATWISVLGQIIMLFSLIVGSIYRAGENNLLANIETITGRDINGDGYVGKAPTADPNVLANAISQAMMKQSEERTVVKGFQRGETPPPSEPKGAHSRTHIHPEHDEDVQPERLETRSVQPEREQLVQTERVVVKEVTNDVTKLIQNIRNWYRRDDERYPEAKRKLTQAGYRIIEISDTSLKIEKGE